jgi:hypothetical protein
MRSSPTVSHLLTPLYLGAVGGLILNDFVLKGAFPGFVTGKVSDFLGLFAFAVFWAVVLPRWTSVILFATAIAFVVWKSSLSSVLIEGWNAAMPFRIGRVVDDTDLLALFVLPFSAYYLRREWSCLAPKAAHAFAVSAISLFAFAATSRLPLEEGKDNARSGNYEAAVRQFDEMIKADPKFAEAYYHRGIAKLKSGDTVGGEADVATAASLDPKYKTQP